LLYSPNKFVLSFGQAIDMADKSVVASSKQQLLSNQQYLG